MKAYFILQYCNIEKMSLCYNKKRGDMMKKILIVEDDESIRIELSELLQASGYEPVMVTDFENVETEILKKNPDLILLDINIPYVNGEILLQKIRKNMDTPVIMVTSKNTEADELLSMMYGADDYITKPYNPNILLFRIANIFKRQNKNEEVFSYFDIDIDKERGILRKNGVEVFLTKNEMLIFSYLVMHKNEIVTRDELMTTLWDSAFYINDNALTVNISRLRAKLKEIGYENAIETRKGYGYILHEIF